eukprot:7277850-Pyramimonas_sp.AAC.1
MENKRLVGCLGSWHERGRSSHTWIGPKARQRDQAQTDGPQTSERCWPWLGKTGRDLDRTWKTG